LRLHPSAQLVREQDLSSIVVEGRRVPVGKIGIGRRIETNGMRWIADVEQQTVTAAGAARSTDRRVQRDVVTLTGAGAWTGRRRRRLADHFGDGAWKLASQRLAFRGSRSARATARLDDRLPRW